MLKFSFCIYKQPAAKIRFFLREESQFSEFMKLHFLLFILIGIGSGARAQDWCDPAKRPVDVAEGGFKIVGASAGCAPFEVKVEKTKGANYRYIYNYKGGDPSQGYMSDTNTTSTYLQQGSFRILQLGSNGTGSVFCQNVEVFLKPNFSVKACSGRRVQLTIADDSVSRRYDAFLVDWGATGLPPTRVEKSAAMSTFIVYPDASARTITVTGIYNGTNINCALPARQSIIPSNVSTSAAKIQRVTTREDGLIDVLVKGAAGITADLQMSAGGTTSFMTTGQATARNDTSTFTVRNVDALKNSYCFRLAVIDGCDNTGNSNSNVVCSTNLTVTAKNRQNALEWPEYPDGPGFVVYSIKRNSVPIKGVPIRNSLTDTDANVACGEQYCYQLTVALNNGGEAVSPLRCVKAISDETPSMAQNPFASVLEENQKIEVRADAPAVGTTPKYKAVFLRSAAGSGDFQEVGVQQNSLTFLDETADSNKGSYCYKIQYENSCGNRSEPTDVFCSVYLNSKSSKTIDWTAASPFSEVVARYVLDKLNEEGTLVDQIEVGGNTNFEPNLDDPNQQLFRYRILAYNAGSTRQSYSNFFVFKRNAEIYIPDAFSPNADGTNDVFIPKGLFVDTFKMIVYNRWGQSLYQTTKISEGWDGTINGQAASEGTYTYRVELVDSLGDPFVKVGTVLLVR